MKNLQTDFATLSMHRRGDGLMMPHLASIAQLPGKRRSPPRSIWCDPTSDDQADPTARSLTKKSGHPLKAVRFFFQAGMHRTHQHSILQSRKAKVKRRQ
jgi:hypothetical protein